MNIYVTLDNNGYLRGWSSTRSNDDDIELEVGEGHGVLSNPHIFKYENDKLIKDERRQQELITESEEENQRRESESNATKEDVSDLKQTIEELKQIILNAK